MASIKWNDSLAVGVELIDQQHRLWIQHLDDLAAAVQSHEGTKQIAKTLSFLVEYTQFHFSTEERHMVANEYPGLEDHQAKHQELRDTLETLVRDFAEDGATHPLAEAVNTFLGNWLVQHIQEVDMRFGQFLNDRGIVISEES